MNYTYWCNLSDQQLAEHGIARVNLAAATGLPLPFDVHAFELLKRLDEWADIADYGIRRMWKRRARGDHAELTGSQYRILVMLTVLQRNLGVTYNWAFSQGEYDASDSRNLFLTGLLTGHGGTCVTMPVLYTAIGRRLGFPLKLVMAKQHSFCRWDGDGERFNIEATSPGFNPRPDEHYRTWPVPITQDEVDAGWYLKSLTPTEELACFIGQRGNCFFDLLKTQLAYQAHAIAHELFPSDPNLDFQRGLTLLMHRAWKHLCEYRRTHPNDPHIPPLQPRSEWERKAMPIINGHINRIFANRQKREKNKVHEQAIQDVVN